MEFLCPGLLAAIASDVTSWKLGTHFLLRHIQRPFPDSDTAATLASTDGDVAIVVSPAHTAATAATEVAHYELTCAKTISVSFVFQL